MVVSIVVDIHSLGLMPKHLKASRSHHAYINK